VPLLVIGSLATLVSSRPESTKAGAVQKEAVVAETPELDYTIFNEEKVPKIRELGGDEFDEAIAKGYTAVKFYSPNCPHCRTVAPHWQTLYEYYWTSNPVKSSSQSPESLNDFHHYYDFDFASVSCIAYGDTCEKYAIGAYPTFVIFKDGKEIERRSGAKDMKEISESIEKVLETIRPGSRVPGGPKLPEVGASRTSDHDPSAVSAAPQASETSKYTDGASRRVKNLPKQPKKSGRTPNPNGISVELVRDNFEELIQYTKDAWFVKFYAPWCPHCQSLAPIWDQLGKEMKGKLNIGEVNCEKDNQLCKDMHVSSYPTMLLFRGGQRVAYDGLRGLGDLKHYAENAMEVEEGIIDVDLESFKKLEEKHEVIFVYFYDVATTSEDFIALERLLLSLIGHAKFVKTDDPAMSERFKVTTWPRLLVSRDGRPTYYTPIAPQEMRDYRRVLRWMKSVWLPIVPELLPSNARDIMDGKLVVLGILTRNRPDEFQLAKNEIKSAALEWMDKQTQLFQLERQDLRDAKQLRIEEAEARNDQRALRAAKSIRIDMENSERKEVTFAWVDGVFWERWIRTTFGIQVSDGEKVVINDEDVSL
jgi:protein disulfide-isomerase